MTFIKLSITIQYCRVFRTTRAQKFLYGYLAFLSVFGLWAMFGAIFTCWPIDAYWNILQGPYGSCMNRDVLSYLNSSLNIVTDLILVIVPLILLRNLQLPRQQKYIVLGVFAVGFFACITSVIRLYALYQISRSDPAEQSGKVYPLRGQSTCTVTSWLLTIASFVYFFPY
jgi:hypothetical protein